MSCEKHIHQLFHDRGLRFTFQRELILNILHSFKNPVTVDDIYTEVSKKTGSIDVSTVYRTLELFRDLGIVTIIDIGTRQQGYILDNEFAPHIHLRCKNCGNLESINIQNKIQVLDDLLSGTGFQPDLLDFTISGICNSCLNKKLSPK